MEAQARQPREQLRLWVGHALLALMGATALAASAAWAALAPGSAPRSASEGAHACGHAAQAGCDNLACALLSRVVQADLCLEPARADCDRWMEGVPQGASAGIVLRGGRPVRWHHDEVGAPCIHDEPLRLFGVAGFDLRRATPAACADRSWAPAH